MPGRRGLALLWVALIMGLPVSASAALLFGLSSEGHVLVHFHSDQPSVIVRTVALSGLAPGERVVGIDIRPATGQLYGVGIVSGSGDTGRLYRIDPFTGASTPIGVGPFATDMPPAASYGVDFNPAVGVDRLRVASGEAENLRLVPSSGLRADSPVSDTNLSALGVTAVAHARDFPAPGQTTLFGINSLTGSLVTIGGPNLTPSPNTGSVLVVGSLQVPLVGDAGLDIGPDGTFFAVMTAGKQTGLYTIDPATGAASLVGPVGDGNLRLGGLAVAPAASVTISPASGVFSTLQHFDIVVFLDQAGQSVTASQITLDGDDLTEPFLACVVAGVEALSGVRTLRCPNVPASLLGVGSHIAAVAIVLSDGTTATGSAAWTVIETIE